MVAFPQRPILDLRARSDGELSAGGGLLANDICQAAYMYT